jgi:hypothetical protein
MGTQSADAGLGVGTQRRAGPPRWCWVSPRAGRRGTSEQHTGRVAPATSRPEHAIRLRKSYAATRCEGCVRRSAAAQKLWRDKGRRTRHAPVARWRRVCSPGRMGFVARSRPLSGGGSLVYACHCFSCWRYNRPGGGARQGRVYPSVNKSGNNLLMNMLFKVLTTHY